MRSGALRAAMHRMRALHPQRTPPPTFPPTLPYPTLPTPGYPVVATLIEWLSLVIPVAFLVTAFYYLRKERCAAFKRDRGEFWEQIAIDPAFGDAAGGDVL